MAKLHFVLPGDPETRTGGFIYDRRITEGLLARGHEVATLALPAEFPDPGPEALRQAEALFAGLPDGVRVVVDGLALGVLPDVVAPHAARLELTALVHHPLAAEAGLSEARRDALFESEKRALALVSRIVTTSRHTADSLADYGVDVGSVVAVHPGVEAAPLAAGSGEGPFALLCVANLVPRKGHDLLISALARIADLDWRLTCAGNLSRDPAWTEELCRRCAEAGLAERVRFLGEVEDAELERLYATADLFVLASRYEGFGMVFSEAVARGLPVIAGRAGGMPEAVPEGAGLLLPPGDEAALAEALQRLIGDPQAYAELRAGARAARDRLQSWAESAALFARALGLETGS